jgi:hypothetical protein
MVGRSSGSASAQFAIGPGRIYLNVPHTEKCQEGNFILFDYGIPVAAKPDF